jgi:hypothetical protein
MNNTYQPNSLFRPGPNFDLNACVGTNGGPYEFGEYGEGFFEGGFQIIESIKKGAWAIDLLIYPATFSFRHGIELYLKHLVKTLSIVSPNTSYSKTHSLKDNWSTFQLLVKATNEKSFDRIELSIAEDIIDDFCNIDPTGQVFRYPEDLKGNKHLEGLAVINVEVLGDGMKVLHELLEKWRLTADYLAENNKP